MQKCRQNYQWWTKSVHQTWYVESDENVWLLSFEMEPIKHFTCMTYLWNFTKSVWWSVSSKWSSLVVNKRKTCYPRTLSSTSTFSNDSNSDLWHAQSVQTLRPVFLVLGHASFFKPQIQRSSTIPTREWPTLPPGSHLPQTELRNPSQCWRSI